jgi:hypothetical protein
LFYQGENLYFVKKIKLATALPIADKTHHSSPHISQDRGHCHAITLADSEIFCCRSCFLQNNAYFLHYG